MASKIDNRAGGDTIPPPRKVNSLQSLMKLRPINGCQWSTIAFVLNRDMIKPDGTLDDLHAVIFPLGSFYDQDKAEEHAKNVIAITGHPGVIVAQYGAPVKLTTKFDPDNVVEVALDPKGRIIELESAQYKREKEEYEKRLKIERDIMIEAEEENDPDNIEHFKRQCFLAIKNRSSYQVHTREADTAWQNYKKREMSVREHFARHPEHESQWLPYLKEKLTERGELDLYNGIEVAYKELRDELLGLVDSSDDEIPLDVIQSDTSDKIVSDTFIYKDGVFIPIKSDSNNECENGVCTIPSSEANNECENGICMVVTTEHKECEDQVESPEINDECENGVCMVVTSEQKECEDKINDECENGICMVVTSEHKDDVILSEEDDMIAPEDIPVEVTQEEVTSDPGFVDEDIILSTQSPPIVNSKNTLTNRAKKNKKRGRR